MNDDRDPTNLQPAVQDVLSRIPITIALLDEHRQVVFGRDRLMALAGAQEVARPELSGPGDLLGCVNALAAKRGCGTSDACYLCGAYCAIAESTVTGMPVTRECRIRYRTDSGIKDLDLTVTAAPYESGGKRHTLLTVQDASHEKRRRALERVFFHDLANIASGLAGLADAIQRAREINEQRKMLGMMDKSARSLIDEIEAQRQLLSAETGDLAPNPQRTNSLELMRGVCEALRYHLVADGRSIVVEKHADDVTWLTDPILLRRVLVNLAKNGLEAIPPGGVVTLGSHDDGDTIVLTVHNDGEIAPEARYQLFQRSFSTKGAGRGLGSYSVRLLTERYLGGTVSFTSSDEHGTLFRIALPVVIR